MTESGKCEFYRDISFKDRAALLLHFMADGNLAEVQTVIGSVPPSMASSFGEWRKALVTLALLFGAAHWQLTAKLWKNIHAGDAQEMRSAEGNLLALDRALDRVAKEYAVDQRDLRRIAGVQSPYVPLDATAAPDVEAELGYYAHLAHLVRK